MATSLLQGDDIAPELSSYSFVLDNQSIPINDYGTFSFNIARSGYTALGIIGVYLRNATTSGGRVTNCSLMQWYLSNSTTAMIRIRNRASSGNAAVIKITIYVLYEKNNS